MKKPWNVPSLIATLLIKRNMIIVTDPTSMGRPCGWTRIQQDVACWHLYMLKMIKQVRRDPSRWIKKRRRHNIDFRVPSLSHSVVKEAEHLRVQELVQRIENHLHRAALQADLQQNNVYNPFSENSKEMIRELGNVELFELCETTPKVPCSNVFFIGIKELCLALADNTWFTANPAPYLIT